MKNGCGEEQNNSYCYFHPREAVIGVCPLCLNERLLVLASKQSHQKSSSSSSSASTTTANNYSKSHTKKNKPPLSFHKIFDFSSLLHRLELRSRKSHLPDHRNGDVSTSQEDSFISIKFEDNGMASWDKKQSKQVCSNSNNKVSLENCNKKPWNHQSLGNEDQPEEMAKSVIELGKPRSSSLRWRKRIDHVFQLIRWKKSNKTGTMCHVGSKVEGVKVRKGWIRTLSKKRNMEME